MKREIKRDRGLACLVGFLIKATLSVRRSMRSISLFALGLAGSATAFVLPAPLPLAKRASVLRMNDPPAPPPPAPAPVAAPAPAPAALDEKAAAEKAFQEMKEKGNAKRCVPPP